MLTDKEKFLIAAHDGQVEDKVYITGRLVKATAEIKRMRFALAEADRELERRGASDDCTARELIEAALTCKRVSDD